MFAVEMNDLALKVSTLLLKVILKMSKEFQQVITNSNNQDKIERRINTWNQEEISEGGSTTFIKAIRIAPFTVEISAQIKLDELDADNIIFFGTVLNALGVIITNI